MRYCRRALFAVALLIPTASPAWGQPSVLSGYLQTVSLLSISGGFSESDLALYSRLRVAAEPEFESVSLTLAYELTATIPQPEDSYVTVARVSGVGADSNDWLDLHGVVTDGKQYNAQHRIDRLQFNWSLSDKVEVNLGRQAISWGTTLFLTPADPFIPFHPVDPFREFRSGTDAIRLRFYPNPLSECDLVFRPSRLDGEEEFTALARGLTTWHNWEVSTWGGMLYDEFAGAVGCCRRHWRMGTPHRGRSPQDRQHAGGSRNDRLRPVAASQRSRLADRSRVSARRPRRRPAGRFGKDTGVSCLSTGRFPGARPGPIRHSSSLSD